MKSLPSLQVISGPFAYNGIKNTIPDAPTSTHHASIEEGFPPITMQPLATGGIPPEGADFNGIFNLTTQFYFAFQNGAMPTYSAAVAAAIGGYPKGAVLWYASGTDRQMKPIVSLIEDNSYNFVENPSYIDGQKWAIAWSTNYLAFQDLGNATATTTVDFANPGAGIKKLTIPASITSALTINIATPTGAASDTWTYELHIAVGATVPTITWGTTGGTIQWLKTSLQQIPDSNSTAIFVFRWQNGNLIANYGGSY